MPRSWLSFTPNSIPFVSVRIGVDRYVAMVDTGSFISMISPELSIGLGLPKQGPQPVISVHGDLRTRTLVTLPSIGFAEIELAPCKAVISDLNPLKPRLDLLLGVNAFTNRRLHIDFGEGRIYLLG
jgi:predicted aspartyl protease